MNVALVSMPWPLFNRPSVQLGVLKSFLEKNAPFLKVKAFHPYLSVAANLGFETYYSLCDSSWLSEAVGAGLLFPEKLNDAKRLFLRLKGSVLAEYERILKVTEGVLREYLTRIPWERFSVVGFSVCLNQLTLSLWAAKLLKEKYPHLVVVFGGSMCSEDLGRSYLRAFPWIDFVVNGEGERPFLELLRRLKEGKRPFGVAGVFFRDKGEVVGEGFQELSPSEIPSPDYSDYFAELNNLSSQKRFFPVVPLEFSRGCWWGKCRFCNLNLQWHGYRKKPVSKVLEEVKTYAHAGVLDFAFVDNCLDKSDALSLFEILAKDGFDYRFFAELRAIYSPEELGLMKRGGLFWVQVGIEALSDSLLKKMGKGVSVLENIAVMKYCEEVGLELSANLICHFPSSTKEEVEETLRNLEFVFPFRPLTTVSFWLGYFSPVWKNPSAYGIKRLRPHAYYGYLFPKEVLNRLTPLAWSYDGDRGRQLSLWKPVIKRVKEWRRRWHELRAKEGPLLYWRRGDGFIVVRQVLPDGRKLHHRLKGKAMDICLFLRKTRTFRELREKFGDIPESELKNFLNSMYKKRLIFKSKDGYLFLPIKFDGP